MELSISVLTGKEHQEPSVLLRVDNLLPAFLLQASFVVQAKSEMIN